jgi:hypothetical protein
MDGGESPSRRCLPHLPRNAAPSLPQDRRDNSLLLVIGRHMLMAAARQPRSLSSLRLGRCLQGCRQVLNRKGNRAIVNITRLHDGSWSSHWNMLLQ